MMSIWATQESISGFLGNSFIYTDLFTKYP